MSHNRNHDFSIGQTNCRLVVCFCLQDPSIVHAGKTVPSNFPGSSGFPTQEGSRPRALTVEELEMEMRGESAQGKQGPMQAASQQHMSVQQHPVGTPPHGHFMQHPTQVCLN